MKIETSDYFYSELSSPVSRFCTQLLYSSFTTGNLLIFNLGVSNLCLFVLYFFLPH